MRTAVLLRALVLLPLLFSAGRAQYAKPNAYPNLSFSSPVCVTNASDNTDRMFVVEQGGVIKVFPNNPSVTSDATFLDISDSIIAGGELGLLSLAFHPQYSSNRYFYVDYTRDNPLRTVISRFTASASN